MTTLAAIIGLILAQSPPFEAFEGAKLTWAWEYPTNQPIARFRMLTNGSPAFDFTTNLFNATANDGTNWTMVGKSPQPVPSGSNVFSLVAVAANGLASDPSRPPVPIIAKPIRLTIVAPSPFKATFGGNRGGEYRIEGTADFQSWQALGIATEAPPLSGLFSFVDAEKRTNILYRIAAP